MGVAPAPQNSARRHFYARPPCFHAAIRSRDRGAGFHAVSERRMTAQPFNDDVGIPEIASRFRVLHAID